jgi:small subunit ribosomal protein S9
VTGLSLEDYFKNVAWLTTAVEPLKFTETVQQLDVKATAKGGGVGGQAGAVRMGLSRALSVFNAELRPGLRKNGFLTRDSRMKERKKYGQKGARRRFQFSKR